MSHSEISPSNAHRWMRCPGSVQLLRNVPPETESSESASLGTLKHALMAQFVMLCQSVSSSVGVGGDWIASSTEYLKHHPLATDELRDGDFGLQLANYADYLMRDRDDIKRPTSVAIESPLDLASVHPGMRGTADAIIYSHGDATIEVVDYKSGTHPVGPHDNEQLMLYLIGALKITSDGHCACNDYCMMTIAQPSSVDGPLRFDSCGVSIDELLDFMDIAKFRATIALHADKPTRAPSDTACQWCRAKAICPEYREYISADFILDAAQIPDDIVPDDDWVRRVLDNRKNITTLIKSCQDYAIGKLNSGDNFAGYQVVEKPGRRSVIKSDAIKEDLEALFGLDALQPAGVVTLNRLARQNDVSIDFAITRGESKMTLVPIEDVSGDFKTEEEKEDEN